MCAQAVYTQPPDNESDTFQIMVATDTHLGYKESDALIKNDSFEAFEEVLQLYHHK
jgi:double-strand break repair protein MRE11